jgi:hypothetical protein
MPNKFYCVVVSYKSDNEYKLFRISNLTGKALKEFRENLCTAGVYRKIDADTGEIILPWTIKQIRVYKQAHFFNAAEEDKKLIK